MLLQFAAGSLPNDLGRRNGTPRLQRVCTKCDAGVIGDERHVVFECAALAQLRLQYAPLFAAQTMLEFMWQEDVVSVAHYLRKALLIMQSGDAEDLGDASSNQP